MSWIRAMRMCDARMAITIEDRKRRIAGVCTSDERV
jgi:hypothetical protein